MMPTSRRELLRVEEVADEVGLTPAAIYSLRFRGRGPRAIRIGRRLLFDRRDVDAWIEENREAASQQ